MIQCGSSWIADAVILDNTTHNYSFFESMPISTKYATYHLQSGLVEHVNEALNIDPTCAQLTEQHQYTNRIGMSSFNNLPFGGFREEMSDNILNSVYTLSSIQEFWK